jgi:TrwC relaxase
VLAVCFDPSTPTQPRPADTDLHSAECGRWSTGVARRLDRRCSPSENSPPPGAGRYYVDQVARGAEDYYAGEGEFPGYWTGRGVGALGLNGAVRDVQIVRLLEGRDPASGLLLRRSLASGAVAGFDLTSVPRSP